MQVNWLDADGHMHDCDVADIPEILASDDKWVWVDIPEMDDAGLAVLHDVFAFHPRAIHECRERNHVPRLHYYKDHIFIVLHRPAAGARGHMHYLELDQFIGPNYLVTVHGPRNPAVALELMLVETNDIRRRLAAGRVTPKSPNSLSYAIVSTIIRGEEEYVNKLARVVGKIEKRVMGKEADHDPQGFLEELYTERHALLTVRTMSAQSSEIYGRAAKLMSDAPKPVVKQLIDLRDQYDRVASISDSQIAFLAGVTEYYRARTDTKMTIAAERLAVIAAVTLPVTAISSVVGMNVIVNEATQRWWLFALLTLMSTLSLILLRWAKRQGWW